MELGERDGPPVLSKGADSLLGRVRQFVSADAHPLDALVPVDDFATYYLVASEIARMAVSEADNGLCLIVDARTAAQVDAVGSAHAAAGGVYVFGAPPDTWPHSDRMIRCASAQISPERDLFLVAVSNSLSLALVCHREAAAFHGIWTGLRIHVVGITRALIATAGIEADPKLAVNSETAVGEDRSLRCSLRIMELMTRQLNWRQRDITKDKDDLHSVLNILKSASAKRRAHDILYGFVQQIAQVIQVDRCSVVRVWEGDDRGHVLASHEDKNIADLVIDLAKYPEIRRAMDTRQKVIINDTQRDPLLRPYAEVLQRARISAIIVIPVVLFDQNVGSFLLRAHRSEGTFSLRDISFCEIVAAATSNALERAYLFESIQKANEQLEYLAVTDGLTGLYNRRYFLQRFEEEFERSRRYNLPLSCMIMDIDNFKKINDTFGHLQGDTILRGVAATMLEAIRKTDTVARYGGEEFVVMMPQTGIDGARVHAERVCSAIGSQKFEGMPEDRPTTVSIGVAAFDPKTMPTCEALIHMADEALYVAKREGKNRVVVGNPEEPAP